MHCVNELCYTKFSIFLSSYIIKNQISLKSSLAQKLKLIFIFYTIMGQVNIPFGTHMGHKGWRKDQKTFKRCYTIALKC